MTFVRVRRFRLALFATLAASVGAPALVGCGGDDDGGEARADGGTRRDSGSDDDDVPDPDARDSGIDDDDDDDDDDDYQPPDLEGRLAVSHYVAPYEARVLDTGSFDALGMVVAADSDLPTGAIAAIAGANAIAITLEGADSTSIIVVDAESFEPIEGSPYPVEAKPSALAFDERRERLYVACLGTLGDDDGTGYLTVFDTSRVPFEEVDESPVAIDVPAVNMAVDPVTGRLYGVSVSSFWAVDVDSEIDHVGDSPIRVDDGTFSGLAVDPGRRRVYVGNRNPAATQKLHAFDLDSFEEVDGSPLDVPRGAIGDLAVHLGTGDVYGVDYNRLRLFGASAEPFSLRDLCGDAEGCEIPVTETGLAIDHEQNRLFIAHLPSVETPDSGPGFVTAWDIADPDGVEEITESGSRPRVGTYPNRAIVY